MAPKGAKSFGTTLRASLVAMLRAVRVGEESIVGLKVVIFSPEGMLPLDGEGRRKRVRS